MSVWIEKHRGKYRVREELRADGRVSKRTLVTLADEASAQRFLVAHLERLKHGAGVSTTLGAWVEGWLDRRELHGSQKRERVKGIDDERSVAKRHVLPSPLASRRLTAITRAEVEDFAIWLRSRTKVNAVRTRAGTELRETSEPISRQTQRHALRIVRGALSDAKGRVLDENPAEAVRVPRGRAADLSDDWLRSDEIATLLSCEKLSARDRTAYACAIGLGLRLNDLKAIRIEHVRLDADAPYVTVAIEKSEIDSHRVPVLPWLRPWVSAHLDTLATGSEWLFPSQHRDARYFGKRLGESYDFAWAEKVDRTRETREPGALEIAGVGRRIRFHDLRGTTATHLALGTWGRVWSLHEIQQLLAHSDQRVTERYVRRAQDELGRAAQGTIGGPASPPISPPRSAKPLRTQQESNLRPSASEAGARLSVLGHIRPLASPLLPPAVDELARAFLAELSAESLGAFLGAVERLDVVRLTREAKRRGPHRMQRGIELAALLLGEPARERTGT